MISLCFFFGVFLFRWCSCCCGVLCFDWWLSVIPRLCFMWFIVLFGFGCYRLTDWNFFDFLSGWKFLMWFDFFGVFFFPFRISSYVWFSLSLFPSDQVRPHRFDFFFVSDLLVLTMWLCFLFWASYASMPLFFSFNSLLTTSFVLCLWILPFLLSFLFFQT